MIIYLVVGLALFAMLILTGVLLYQSLMIRHWRLEAKLRGRAQTLLRLADAQLATDEAAEILRLLDSLGLQIEELDLSGSDRTRLINLSHRNQREGHELKKSESAPRHTNRDEEGFQAENPTGRVLH